MSEYKIKAYHIDDHQPEVSEADSLMGALLQMYAVEIDGVECHLYIDNKLQPIKNDSDMTFDEWYYAAGVTSPQNEEQYHAWLRCEDPAEHRPNAKTRLDATNE